MNDLKDRINKLADGLSFMLDIAAVVLFFWYSINLIKRLFEPKDILSALTTAVSVIIWLVTVVYCFCRVISLLREAKKIHRRYNRWLKQGKYDQTEAAEFNDAIADLKFIWNFDPLAWPARHEIKPLYMSRRRLESNNEEE